MNRRRLFGLLPAPLLGMLGLAGRAVASEPEMGPHDIHIAPLPPVGGRDGDPIRIDGNYLEYQALNSDGRLTKKKSPAHRYVVLNADTGRCLGTERGHGIIWADFESGVYAYIARGKNGNPPAIHIATANMKVGPNSRFKRVTPAS